MTAYLLTVCGAVFLSVVASFVIPRGRLNRSVAFVLRIICIAVIVSPVAGVFTISEEKFDDMVDYEYICELYSKSQSAALEEYIAEKYSARAECSVEIGYGESGFFAKSVEVCLLESYDGLSEKIYEYLKEADYINITVYESDSGMVQG